jgi:tRNA 2-selenouridine synthase
VATPPEGLDAPQGGPPLSGCPLSGWPAFLYQPAMAITLSTLADLAAFGFDDIIDARAPAEYAEDHLPGAISLPVLSDAERAEVGTIYKQVTPFTAKKLGAALVARNVATHLLGPLADKPGGWRPLVYCWRGGQRSGSFALILAQIGWRVETLKGGYKAWRALVVHEVYDTPVRAPMVVLDGNTGSAKTDILNLLPAHGLQVIDLEGLANHRGSLFGARGPQPSQKAFEGRLAQALAGLDPSRPVVVEAESSKIGNCRLPPELWKAMIRAPRIALRATPADRARYLTQAYADIVRDENRLRSVIDLLRPQHAQEVIADWQAMAGAGAFADLAESLMVRHYDPRYAKHRARAEVPMIEVEAGPLTADTLPEAAARVAAAIGGGMQGRV